MNILVKALLSFTLTVIFTSSVYAQKNSINWCKSFTHQKVTHAIFLDKKGSSVTDAFNFGQLDARKSSKGGIFASNKFRLILFPRTLTADNLPSQDVYIDLKKTKSQCPLTSEYIGVVVFTLGRTKPGNIDVDIDVNIDDTNSDSPEHLEIITKKMTGSLSAPWIEVPDTSSVMNNFKDLWLSKAKAVEIQLKNTGNRPAMLGTWTVANDKQAQDIQLQDKSCANKLLEPQETCLINLLKTNPVKAKDGIYQWHLNEKTTNSSISLFVEQFSDGNVNASIINH